MTRKCILNRRIDLYTDSWTKYAKAKEVEHSEEDDDTSVVGAALKNLFKFTSLFLTLRMRSSSSNSWSPGVPQRTDKQKKEPRIPG